MNFFKNNWGIIILFIFFIVMFLFISSGNNKKTKNTNTSSGTILINNTGAKSDNLSETGALTELLKVVELQEETLDNEEGILGKENITNLVKNNKIENKGILKKFNINVYSLKLNDKYFKKTITYMKKGDIVKQLTNENYRGCFNVEIISSFNNKNNGKQGYVCKKYLKEYSENIKKEEKVEIIKEKENISFKNNLLNENKYYKINIHSLKLNNKNFNKTLAYISKTDTLKQLTKENISGCFKVKIVLSDIVNSLGKEGYVCKKYLTSKLLPSNWLAF